jgi:hypothetical protein
MVGNADAFRAARIACARWRSRRRTTGVWHRNWPPAARVKRQPFSWAARGTGPRPRHARRNDGGQMRAPSAPRASPTSIINQRIRSVTSAAAVFPFERHENLHVCGLSRFGRGSSGTSAMFSGVHLSQYPHQSALQCYVSGRSARPAEPRVKHVSGQPMLRAGFAGFHDEFMHPLWLVFDMLTAAKAINRQTHGFIQRPGFDLNRMLDTIRIPERHSTLFHLGRISYSLFVRLRLKRSPYSWAAFCAGPRPRRSRRAASSGANRRWCMWISARRRARTPASADGVSRAAYRSHPAPVARAWSSRRAACAPERWWDDTAPPCGAHPIRRRAVAATDGLRLAPEGAAGIGLREAPGRAPAPWAAAIRRAGALVMGASRRGMARVHRGHACQRQRIARGLRLARLQHNALGGGASCRARAAGARWAWPSRRAAGAPERWGNAGAFRAARVSIRTPAVAATDSLAAGTSRQASGCARRCSKALHLVPSFFCGRSGRF